MAFSKLIILGHSGFIGSRLTARLQERHPKLPIVGLSYPPFDLSRPEAADELMSTVDERSAVLFLSGIKRQFGDNLEIFQKNLAMAVHVAQVMEKRPPARVVFFSSAAVYGEDVHNTDITEDTPVCPTSYYGIAKYASERLLTKASSGRVSLLIVRPPTVYGPGDTSGTYGPVAFVETARRGQPITLWGDGCELRDFIWLDDLIEVVARLALESAEGVLNVASGQSVTFRQMVDYISQRLGRPIEVRSRPRTKARVDHRFRVDRLRSLLPDFHPTTMEQGIERLLATSA